MESKPRTNPAARAFRLWLAVGLAAWFGVVLADAPVVGAITLKLGEAWLVASDGVRRPAAEKASLQAGEAVETAASGHVHLRFIDGGTVAVRPGSRLVVLEYRDPASGGAVRFRLERGVVRSITGRFGEADRSRFRLNTPIVAIGITGTDFVVESSEQRTRAIVYSGGIIAAPFDDACTPGGLGPCVSPRARELTAAMGPFMLEIKRGDLTPALLPRNGLAAAEEARKTADAALPKTEALTQAVAVEAIPDIPLPAALAWGRWPQAAVWPDDDLTLPREEAAAGRERVAENSRYVLYRLPQTEPLPTQGVAQLTLAGAQAHLVQPGQALPAQVLDGQLSLDFAARRFATQLTLESQPTGRVPFAAAGALAPDGSFALIDWQTRVKGAWGAGGSGPSAAYLFERATPQGMLMGITQWR